MLYFLVSAFLGASMGTARIASVEHGKCSWTSLAAAGTGEYLSCGSLALVLVPSYVYNLLHSFTECLPTQWFVLL